MAISKELQAIRDRIAKKKNNVTIVGMDGKPLKKKNKKRSKELQAIRDRIVKKNEPRVEIVKTPEKDVNVSIVDKNGEAVVKKESPKGKFDINLDYTDKSEKTTPQQIKETELTPVVEAGGKILDKIKEGYTPSGDDSALDVGLGALKEMPRTTLSFFSNVGQGEAEAGKAILNYANRFGLGGDTTKKIIASLDDYSKKAEEGIKDDKTVLDTLGNAIGSQAFYFIPGLGIAKLGNASRLSSLVKFSKVAGIGASSLLESAGEAGAVYEDELKRWGDKDIAAGKADFTFTANLLINLVTNKLGGMFDTDKAKSSLGEAIKIFKGAGGEFTQEGVQQMISNIAEDRPMVEGSLEAAIYGAILGGVGGGGNISRTAKISDLISGEGRALLRSLASNEKGTLDLDAIRKDITARIHKKAPVIKERIKQENRAKKQAIITENRIDGIKRKNTLSKLKEKIKVRDIKSTAKGDIKAITTKFKNKITDIKRGIELGKLKGRILDNEVARVKKEFTDEAMTLPLKERGKLIKKIKNIKSNKQLVDGVRYIAKLDEESKQRKTFNQIRKTIKPTKVRGKKPKGKYTPEIQRALNEITEISKMSIAEARSELAKSVSDTDRYKTPREVSRNRLLSLYVGNSKQRGLLLDHIKSLKEKGEAVNALRRGNESERIESMASYATSQITGGKGIHPSRLKGEANKKTAIVAIKQFLKGIGKTTFIDWQGFLEAMEFNSSTKNKSLGKMFGVSKNESSYKRYIKGYVSSLNDAISSIYNVKNKNSSVVKKMRQLSTEKVKFNGQEWTRDELIKRYMETLDPTLEKPLRDGNGWTDETFEEIKKVMRPDDIKFAEWQMAAYQRIYLAVNETYKKMNGVDLPFNEFYSPIKRSGYSTKPGHTEFGDEIEFRRAVSSRSFNARQKNVLPLERQGSLKVLDQHNLDMGYYMAWSEKIREIDNVFNKPEVKMALKQEFSDSFIKALYQTIDNLASGRNKNKQGTEWLDTLRKNYVVGQLALKPVLTVKQLVSTIAYNEKISGVKLTAGILDFFSNPIKNYNILQKESAFISERGSNIERDIKEAMSEDVLGRYKKSQSLINALLLNIKIGDKTAIVLGSWAMRRARIEEGKMSMEEIIEEYEEFGSETQQSSDISRQSIVQSGGGLGAVFTVFKSSLRTYFQKEFNATKSLFRKDGFSKQNLKKVAKVLYVYHVMLPVAFQYISNMGGWDEEDKEDYKRAALLGNINGIYIAGDVITSVVRAAMGSKVWDESTLVGDVAKDLTDLIKVMKDDDISSDDFARAVDLFNSATTGLTGLPIKYSYNAIESLVEGTNERALKTIIGYSDYRIKKSEGKPTDINKKIDAMKRKANKMKKKTPQGKLDAMKKKLKSY